MIELPKLDVLPPLPIGATPPPPPPRDPRPGPLQLWVLATLLISGLAALLVAWLLAPPHAELVQHGGAFALVYAALVAAGWMPAGILSRRVDRLLDEWVNNASSGYYGVMALSTFALLEFKSILDEVAGFDIDSFSFGRFIGELASGFSVESLMNMIWASIWPGWLFSHHSPSAVLVFVVVSWIVFSGGSRVLPHHTLRSRKERDEDRAR